MVTNPNGPPSGLRYSADRTPVRHTLATQGAFEIDGLYAGRPAIPTGRLILNALAGIRLILGTRQSPPAVPEPTGLQLHLLDLLDIDPRDLR
jgi:hypothetical protein